MTDFKYSDAVVLVFAKAPIQGEVNTRLIPDIGVEAATNLQSELILSRLKTLQENNLCATHLWCSPNTEYSFFQNCKKHYDIELFEQFGDDLGLRMSFAIKQSLQNFTRVILIGTDAPSLTTDHIETSITELNNNDMVLAPAEDGGYVLIGMSQHNHNIFQSINWGSDSVLEATRDKISKNKLTSYELEPCWDIDRVEDYQRYEKSLFNHL